MGIEDQPAVEESTEPPICGYINVTSEKNPGRRNQGTAAIITSITGLPSSSEKAKSSITREDHVQPHTLAVDDLEQLLETDVENGLANGEAVRRLALDGPNKVEGAHGLSAWKILLRQASNSLTMVLILVMALSFAINDFIEAGVIATVILLNIVVGYVQSHIPLMVWLVSR